MSVLSKPYFHNEEAAFAYLESVIWSDGKVCPHCGGFSRITKVKANPSKRIREGLWRCGDCKKQFTVKIGTVFEHMRLPLHKALQAVYLMTSSKKGISAHQLHRVLEITYKSAWFLAHRIREAMREGALAPFGGNGGIVEVDETFIGIDLDAKQDVKQRNWLQRNKVLALVDRSTGRARAMVVEDLTAKTIAPILAANISSEAMLMTDEAPRYRGHARMFAGHEAVNHTKGEYGRGEFHTNTIEGYFSIFKRGMKGIYQHCGKKHLHRYVAEFEFRYNNREALGCNDWDRAGNALRGIIGKRITYRRPDGVSLP